jgi:hypothetical protein
VTNENELKSVLCRKLGLDQEQGCSQVVTNESILETVVGWVFWLLLLAVLAGVGALVVYYYRNRLRREVNKELKMQVSTAVEHYYQLTEASDAK